MAMWNGFLLGSNSTMTCSSSRSSRWSAFWKSDWTVSYPSKISSHWHEMRFRTTQNAVIRLIPNFCLDRPFRVFNPLGYPFLPKLPFQVFNLPGVQSFLFLSLIFARTFSFSWFAGMPIFCLDYSFYCPAGLFYAKYFLTASEFTGEVKFSPSIVASIKAPPSKILVIMYGPS